MERRLSILIATIGRRNDSFLELMASLVPQIERNNIEVVAYWNTGEKLIGDLRQALLKEAKGEYICFIDDDDRVPAYYCDEIFFALNSAKEKVDYVGFQVELFEKIQGIEHQMPPVFHSIRYGVWHQDEHGYYRGITHLNPIKRELALQAEFGKNGIGEDESWARTLMPLVRTEAYINKIMYYYHHDRENTSFGGIERKRKLYKRPKFEHAQFRWHPKSKEGGIM